jgi:hypothetical protein
LIFELGHGHGHGHGLGLGLGLGLVFVMSCINGTFVVVVVVVPSLFTEKRNKPERWKRRRMERVQRERR